MEFINRYNINNNENLRMKYLHSHSNSVINYGNFKIKDLKFTFNYLKKKLII
jgi:hypothetical protein